MENNSDIIEQIKFCISEDSRGHNKLLMDCALEIIRLRHEIESLKTPKNELLKRRKITI